MMADLFRYKLSEKDFGIRMKRIDITPTEGYVQEGQDDLLLLLLCLMQIFMLLGAGD